MTLMKILSGLLSKFSKENLSDDEAKAIAPWKLDPESGEDTLNKPISEFKMMKQAQEKANKRKSAVVSPKSAYDPAIKECVGGSAAEACHRPCYLVGYFSDYR